MKFKHKEILEKLFSSNEEQIINTLKELRETGDSSIIYYLIQLLQRNKSEQVSAAIESFLKDLRDQSSAKPLVDAIQNEDFKNIRQQLVSICWQTRLDFSEHLEPFINLVLFADYQTSIEAFTVIEESVPDIVPAKMEYYLTQIKRSYPEDVDDVKKPLVKELVSVLRKI